MPQRSRKISWYPSAITPARRCASITHGIGWTSRPIAKTTDVGRLIVPGYFLPLLHAHPTFGGLTERLKITDGIMELNPEAQPNIADRSLMAAHNCLIEALKVQGEHFHIEGLQAALQTCLRDFLRVWAPDSALLNDAAISASL